MIRVSKGCFKDLLFICMGWFYALICKCQKAIIKIGPNFHSPVSKKGRLLRALQTPSGFFEGCPPVSCFMSVPNRKKGEMKTKKTYTRLVFIAVRAQEMILRHNIDLALKLVKSTDIKHLASSSVYPCFVLWICITWSQNQQERIRGVDFILLSSFIILYTFVLLVLNFDVLRAVFLLIDALPYLTGMCLPWKLFVS